MRIELARRLLPPLGNGRFAHAEVIADKSEWAFVPERIRGSIERGKALIEYAAQSRDSGVLIRKKVEHIAVSNGTAKRIDPIALGPRDFVDEWLSRPWPEMKNWSEAPSLQTKKRQVEKLVTEFGDPTLHCKSPDLWQVEVSFDPYSKPQTKYFLVRWKPPTTSQWPRSRTSHGQSVQRKIQTRRAKDPVPPLADSGYWLLAPGSCFS